MHPHSSGVEKAAAPYGSWESPISAAAVSAAGKSVEGIAVAGDGRLLWVETRPGEGGRAVLVKEAAEPNGKIQDVTPQEFAVRSLAQGYGGGAFAVQGDVVVFSNYSDQRLYKQAIGDNSPLPPTPDYAGSVVRYADGVFDPHFSRYVTMMEDHRKSSSDLITTIAAVSTSVGDVNVAMTFMPFRALIQLKNVWHGLNGVTQTCHGIKHNYGLDISPRKERYRNVFALLVETQW